VEAAEAEAEVEAVGVVAEAEVEVEAVGVVAEAEVVEAVAGFPLRPHSPPRARRSSE
jgi:hypothetical protein